MSLNSKLSVIKWLKLYKSNLVNLSPTARLAQSVEHETLNLRVVGSSPTLGGNFCFTQLFLFLSKKLMQV